ncbi:trigger factor [Clostridium sp. KNHs216]|uniref:trigger factor n=1 Tax=Clostridium sp. KNHs216 TaxID=1550235 RepID=UPI0011537B2E|nr:trigger factor [Clostridium sp. KNHs216]TQI67855.1 trigger factor protein [Clostridium sp. KNHs216]
MTKYTVEQTDHNNVRFRFIVPSAEFDTRLETAYRVNKDKYEMPGVRKGKAERKMAEAYLGRAVFTKPVVDKIVSEAYCKAASEYPEEIYYSPVITIEQNEPGRDFMFSARVRIRPEAKLCDYRSVLLTEGDRKKADEAVRDIPESEQGPTRRYLLQSALINRIADQSTIEIPETMILERAVNMAREFERRLETDQKSLKEYYQECGSDEKTMLAEFAADAKKQLRSRLTLLAIARSEGLEATGEEYDAEIRRLSAMYLMTTEQLKKFFANREGSKLKEDIAVSKAAEFISQTVQRQSQNSDT